MWWPLSTVPGQADTRQVMTCGCAASMASRARVEWAKAPPARISAATQIASMISSGVLPLRMASLVWPLMQYGHWVTCATATAMSCLVFSGSAPSAKTALLKLWKASWTPGASSLRRRACSGVVGWYMDSLIGFSFVEVRLRAGGNCRGLRRGKPAYPHPPDLWSLLEVVPGELAGVLRRELVVQRLGVVVVDQHEARAGFQRCEGLDDQLVADAGDLGTDIDDAVGDGHGGFLSVGQGRRLGLGFQERDVVHGAVQPLGLNRVGVAQQGPRIRREPARFLGLPGAGELAAGTCQNSGESVDGLVTCGFSRHG